MGLFSDSETYVSSVVYNMAGDETKRPNYLQTLVIGNVIHNQSQIAEAMVGSYLNGPGMRFRRFYDWAERTNYNDEIGLVTGKISTGNSLDEVVLLGQIPITPGLMGELRTASIGKADYTFWADQYVSVNSPQLIGTAYTADIDDTTSVITITWVDTTTTSFTPVGFDKAALYIYASYVEIGGEEPQDIVTGTLMTLAAPDSFPSIVGWTQISYTDDGAGTIHGLWQRTTYKGSLPGANHTYSEREYMYQDTVAGVRTYQIDTQDIWHSPSSPIKIFIYKQNGGNAILDAMFSPSNDMGNFYPIIPVRIKSEFLSETFMPDIYELTKKAYKKATTGKLSKLVEQLEDNNNLADIDYAYMVMGVSLNVLENASRKYIYKFFQEILYNNPGSATPANYSVWQSQMTAATASQTAYSTWQVAQSNPLSSLYGTPAPTVTSVPQEISNSINISTGGNPTINYDITISWSSMEETTGTGLIKPEAKVDDLWFTKGEGTTYSSTVYGQSGSGSVWANIIGGIFTNTPVTLNWQETANTWRKLTIVGLRHKNLIYGGKAVDIDAAGALDDGDESGFIIPLHRGIYHSMGLVEGTQMSTACAFMVFNCYEVVKRRWYQTGIFQIVLVVIMVVIAYFTGGASLGASGGILGTNTAVGVALGFTAGTAAAVIIGAVANAIAAMLLVKLITMGATAIFGDKIGAIIGAIVSIFALQVGTAMASGQSFAQSFSGLMRADNILQLTSAVGRGYAGYMQAATAEVLAQQEQVLEDYNQESRQIREMWENTIGLQGGLIDPMSLTSAFGVTFEDMDSFLQRTLMTGSDVADMSMGMLTNFADMTLNMDLPT